MRRQSVGRDGDYDGSSVRPDAGMAGGQRFARGEGEEKTKNRDNSRRKQATRKKKEKNGNEEEEKTVDVQGPKDGEVGLDDGVEEDDAGGDQARNGGTRHAQKTLLNSCVLTPATRRILRRTAVWLLQPTSKLILGLFLIILACLADTITAAVRTSDLHWTPFYELVGMTLRQFSFMCCLIGSASFLYNETPANYRAMTLPIIWVSWGGAQGIIELVLYLMDTYHVLDSDMPRSMVEVIAYATLTATSSLSFVLFMLLLRVWTAV